MSGNAQRANPKLRGTVARGGARMAKARPAATASGGAGLARLTNLTRRIIA